MKYKPAPFSLDRQGFSTVAREPATLLVASDGTAESDHALEFARSYAQDDDAAIHVISICEPGPDPVAWPGLASLPLIHDARATEDGRRDSVRAQIERVAGNRGYWPLTITTGGIADSIARSARELRADLIVTGRGRHTLGDRLLGEEHLVRLIRHAAVPVLAADNSLRAPPKRIGIGVDFGESHLVVAQSPARWVADDAKIFLLHARPATPAGLDDAAEWHEAYDARAREKLNALVNQLEYPQGITFETRLLDGHAGVALSEFCEAEGCDLVVAGAQGAGFVHRLVVGSVATYLLRHAACSLLTVAGGKA